MNTFRGILWSGIERISAQGVQFLLNIIIARMLVPEDYGIIAMLTVFLAISQTFIDSGFANALIQKQDRTDTDYCTIFYFNIAMSILIYIILCISAPHIASFYNTPQLTHITPIIGTTIIINSLSIVQQAKLTIKLDFKKQSIATLTSATISGGIGITMAYYHWGVWAIVVQSITNNFIRVLLLWILSGWIPKLIFSINSFITLFKFGSKLLLSSLLHVFYTNMYTLVIGKVFTPQDLGSYSRAYSFANFPSMNISNILERVIYPVLCSTQHDAELQNKQFIKYIRLGCFITFPIMTWLTVLSKSFITLVLTDKWIEVIPLLQILCIAFLWDPVMRINHLIINAKGRSDLFLKAEIYKKITGIIILLVSLPLGLKAICIGLIYYSFADMMIIIYFNKQITNIGYIKQIKTIVPFFITASLSGLCCYIFTLFTYTSLPIVQLSISLLAGIISYIMLTKVITKQEYEYYLYFVKKIKKT